MDDKLRDVITYEKLLPLARRLSSYYNNKFEIDELINEVWVADNCFKFDNIKIAIHKARFDMLEYIRTQKGRKIYKNKEKVDRPRYLTNVKNMDYEHGGMKDRTNDYFDNIGAIDKNLEKMDNLEILQYILKTVPEEKRKCVYLYYIKQLTTREIGDMLGKHNSSISLTVTRAIKKCNYLVKLMDVKIT